MNTYIDYKFRTRYETDQEFKPEAWLSDEILWGIIKEPFDVRWSKRWNAPHGSRDDEVEIMKKYWREARKVNNDAEKNDAGSLTFAALGIGKLAAGLTSLVVHFEANPTRWKKGPSNFPEDISHATNRVIGSIDENYPRLKISTDDDAVTFENMLIAMDIKAREIDYGNVGRFPTRQKNEEELSDLAREAFYVAKGGVATFLDFMLENDGRFVMEPGGAPRSGDRAVAKRIEIFDSIPRPWAQSS